MVGATKHTRARAKAEYSSLYGKRQMEQKRRGLLRTGCLGCCASLWKSPTCLQCEAAIQTRGRRSVAETVSQAHARVRVRGHSTHLWLLLWLIIKQVFRPDCLGLLAFALLHHHVLGRSVVGLRGKVRTICDIFCQFSAILGKR